MARTISDPIESIIKEVRHASAAEESPKRTASRHSLNSWATRDKRKPIVATAAKSKPQRIALRMEPASALESPATRQISRFTTSRALSSMNLRRASTFSPISVVEISSAATASSSRSEEHTSELQSRSDLVCRLLLEKKKNIATSTTDSTPALSVPTSDQD